MGTLPSAAGTWLPTMEHHEDFERLLTHRAWVRRLAVALVGESAADDVVQDTFVSAWRSPPRDLRAAQGFLGTLTRRIAWRARRTEQRRISRERHAMPDCDLPPVDQMVEGMERMQRLARHVAELDESQRSVVLWHFYEGLEPTAIAARLGIPASTVRSRLARGLACLRVRLEGDHGSDWRLALTPILSVPIVDSKPVLPVWGAMTMGAIWMGTTMKLVSSVMVAAAAVAIWLLSGSGDPLSVTGDDKGEAITVEAQSVSAPDRQQVRELVAPLDSDEPDARVGGAVLPFRGRVVDAHGRAVGNVQIELIVCPLSGSVPEHLDPLSVTESDAMGNFTAERPAGGYRNLPIVRGDWATIRSTRIDEPGADEIMIVVARAVNITGTVVDPKGVPIAEAVVSAHVLEEPSFPFVTDYSVQMFYPSATADTLGRFEFECLPLASTLSVHAQADSYRNGLKNCGEQQHDIQIVLEPVAGQPHVPGIVLDQQGRPVEGAFVCLASEDVRSAADGRFELPWCRWPAGLAAVVPGRQSAFIPAFDEAKWISMGRPDPIELRLGGPALEVYGRVQDHEGKPLDEWFVVLLDDSDLGDSWGLEQLAAGHDPREDDVVSFSDLDGRRRYLPVQRVASTTDSSGQFRVRGLNDRAYELLAYDPRTGRSARLKVRAGARGQVIRVAENLVADVPITVTSPGRQPLAGVKVRVSRPFGERRMVRGCSIITNDDGQGLLAYVPDAPLHISLAGKSIDDCVVEVDPADFATGLHLIAGRYGHVRIEGVTTPASDHELHFLDARAEIVRLWELRDLSSIGWDAWEQHAETSPLFALSELAVEVAFVEQGQVKRKQAIRVTPGKTLVISW